MAKMSKTIVDKKLRETVFESLFEEGVAAMNGIDFVKINDRQYGVILTDANGVERYCRVGVIVAEIREDMTAEELMNAEIKEYHMKQADKAEKAKAKEKKIAKDKARREQEAKENDVQ